jgi:hypothetical protein
MSVLDSTSLLVLGAGTALIGLALLVGGVWRRRRLALGTAALLLTGLGVCGPFFARFPTAGWPLLALGGVCTACLLLSSSYPKRLLAIVLALAADPKAQGGALLLAACLLVIAWPWQLDRQANGEARAQVNPWGSPGPGALPVETGRAWTDRGGPVAVHDVAHETTPTDEVSESFLARSRDRALHLIRTAPPDRGTNCHGWVFTGGRYVVDSRQVERILADNGYQAVATPREGDLVVYRCGSAIIHSALVRSAADDGLIVLESKWTSLGRYLHLPQDYSPEATWTYYRSPRTGHLLRGLDAGSAGGTEGATTAEQRDVPVGRPDRG